MTRPTFRLLHYLLPRLAEAKYDLASSNLPPVPVAPGEDLDNLLRAEPHIEGSPELREMIAGLAGVPPDRVLATAGSSESILLTALALMNPGDRVMVESPAYEPLWKAFELLGADVSFLPRPFDHGFRPDPEALAAMEERPPRLLVLTNLHNPSGTRLGRRGLAHLAAMAEKADFHILVDEIFRESALESPPPCALTLSDRFIVTSSLSKVYGLGGLRLGWCLAAPEPLEALAGVKDFASVAPSLLSDALGVRVLAAAEETRARNRSLVAAGRGLVEEWVAEEERVQWVVPEGHVSFPRYEGDVERLARVALERYGVLIAPGRLFGAPDHFRLCFGMEEDTLVAGLEGLSKALREA